MSDLTIGSLCSGYGGLDLAAEIFFGAKTAWFFEFEKGPSKILEAHWPGITNYGDMTKVDWSTIPKVDIICGGTPCQDLSTAGKRKGMTEGTRSNLWVQMREAIAAIRPRFVLWENVRGALSGHASSEVESEPGLLGESYGPDRPALRAAGRVQGDLAELGYRVAGVAVQASDAGAPHGRFRVFFLAVADPGSGGREERGAPYDEGDRDASGHDARGRDARASTDAEVGGRRRGAMDSAARDGAESLGSDRASADADGSARRGRADEPIGGSSGRAASADDRTGSPADAGGIGERSEPVEQGRESDARRRDPRLRRQDGGADGADGYAPCGCRRFAHDPEWCEQATPNGAVPARVWARGNAPAARAAARAIDRLDRSLADAADLRRGERGAGGWAAGVAAASSDVATLPDASGGGASGESESGIRAEGIDGAGVADERRPGPGGDEWASGADDGEFAASDAGGSGLQGLARNHTASGEAEARAHGEGGDLASADAERGDAERWGVGGDVAGAARSARDEGGESDEVGDAAVGGGAVNWGPYAAAIERWEYILGRQAPAPTSPTGRDGAHRLSAEFVEWMMGLPEGWVTDPAIGIKRNEQLKALGNGVVPQQALLALSIAWAQLVEFEDAA